MASRLRSLDSLCSEGAALDAAALVVTATGRRTVCISLPSSPAGARRKASVVAAPATPEHYRAALLEEGQRIKWSGCLQPQCARCGAHPAPPLPPAPAPGAATSGSAPRDPGEGGLEYLAGIPALIRTINPSSV